MKEVISLLLLVDARLEDRSAYAADKAFVLGCHDLEEALPRRPRSGDAKRSDDLIAKLQAVSS